MDLTVTSLVLIGVGAAVVIVFRSWLKGPFHIRNRTAADFSLAFLGLVQGEDGTRLFVEDEQTKRSVIVLKEFSDADTILFRMESDGAECKPLLPDLENDSAIEVEMSSQRITVRTRCPRRSDYSTAQRVLWKIFRCRGSTPQSTFHTYIVGGKGRDPENSRAKYEEILSDPERTDRQKAFARGMITKLDAWVAKKRSKR